MARQKKLGYVALDPPIDVEMEYRDAKDDVTRRQVSIDKVEMTEAGAITFDAWCHVRDDVRSFRMDRVQWFIDDNGELHRPMRFFADREILDKLESGVQASPQRRKPRSRKQNSPEKPPKIEAVKFQPEEVVRSKAPARKKFTVGQWLFIFATALLWLLIVFSGDTQEFSFAESLGGSYFYGFH